MLAELTRSLRGINGPIPLISGTSTACHERPHSPSSAELARSYTTRSLRVSSADRPEIRRRCRRARRRRGCRHPPAAGRPDGRNQPKSGEIGRFRAISGKALCSRKARASRGLPRTLPWCGAWQHRGCQLLIEKLWTCLQFASTRGCRHRQRRGVAGNLHPRRVRGFPYAAFSSRP